jgi:hypothetical protein
MTIIITMIRITKTIIILKIIVIIKIKILIIIIILITILIIKILDCYIIGEKIHSNPQQINK